MVTATGGGVIRIVLTNSQPMILCRQPSATAALLGSLSYTHMHHFGVPEIVSEVVACLAGLLTSGISHPVCALSIPLGPMQ
jgi:uncharacterized membrane protein YeiH